MLRDAYESHKWAVRCGPKPNGAARSDRTQPLQRQCVPTHQSLGLAGSFARHIELAEPVASLRYVNGSERSPQLRQPYPRARIRILALESIMPSDELTFNHESNKLERSIKPILYTGLTCGTPKIKNISMHRLSMASAFRFSFKLARRLFSVLTF
jgi:hypothetical protein